MLRIGKTNQSFNLTCGFLNKDLIYFNHQISNVVYSDISGKWMSFIMMFLCCKQDSYGWDAKETITYITGISKHWTDLLSKLDSNRSTPMYM